MPGKTSFFNQSGLAGVAYSEQSFDSADGNALQYTRLNAAESSIEFRTLAETLADLDLEIGTDVQAYDADLTTWAAISPSANAQSFVSAATYAAMRVLLDLEAGTDFYSIAAADAAFEPIDGTILKDADIGVTVQAEDATLTSIAALGTDNARMIYTTAPDTWAETVISTLARSLVADLTASDMRTTLGVAIGVDVQAYDATIVVDADIGVTVQAYDADLTTWAGLTPSANAQSLVTAASYAAMRTLLDLEPSVDYQVYDADTAKLDVVQDWKAAQSGEVTVLSDAASIVIDLSLSNNFRVLLGGNRTLANPSTTTPVPGQSGVIKVTQDGTGTRTLAFGAQYVFAGGTAPVLTTTANANDVLSYYVLTTSTILITSILDVK